jgi:hypothetical protein
MYSTCTFCHAPLGANQSLEHFPVGRRLAFDGKRGRLWVVCAVCRQWNLSPFETRWEAIEDAERAYRGTRLRAATGQIGLARLADGTELIRIGEPLRPEFAAWRYGERFLQRWRISGRVGALAGGAVTVLGKGLKLNFLLSIGAAPFVAAGLVVSAAEVIRRRRTSAQLRIRGDTTAWFSQAHVQSMRIERDSGVPEGWRLRVQYRPLLGATRFFSKRDPETILHGDEAHRVARTLLPRVNRGGGPKKSVAAAVDILQRHGDANAILRFVSQYNADETRPNPDDAFGDARTSAEKERPPILRAPMALRLAAEMAVHEELERRALEGDLALIEESWQEAEEIAAIADNLTVSPSVLRALEALRLR